MIDHVILDVRDYAAGKRFYEQALAPPGATDHGPPGLRPHSHETYYAAVCHTQEEER